MRSVDAMQLRKNLGQYVNGAYYRGDEFIIKRAGKPVAALVPLEDLEKLTVLKTQGYRALKALWAANRKVSWATIQKDVEEAVRSARRR